MCKDKNERVGVASPNPLFCFYFLFFIFLQTFSAMSNLLLTEISKVLETFTSFLLKSVLPTCSLQI